MGKKTRQILLIIIFPCQTYFPHRPVISVRNVICRRGLNWQGFICFWIKKKGYRHLSHVTRNQPLPISHYISQWVGLLPHAGSHDFKMAHALPEGRDTKREVGGKACISKPKALPQLQGSVGNRLQGGGSLLPETVSGSVVRKKTLPGPASPDHYIFLWKVICTCLL